MKRVTSATIAIALLLTTLACGPCGLAGGLSGGGGAHATEPPAGDSGVEVEIAGLAESLDSYRAHRTVRDEETGELAEDVAVEWVREPPAARIVYQQPVNDIEEQIAVGGSVWDKVSGVWRASPDDQPRMEITLRAVEDCCLDFIVKNDRELEGATLVGTETVNGVRCKHYVADTDLQALRLHIEVWIADQGGLAPVFIRGQRDFASDTVATQTEVNVTDVNIPITIEPPE